MSKSCYLMFQKAFHCFQFFKLPDMRTLFIFKLVFYKLSLMIGYLCFIESAEQGEQHVKMVAFPWHHSLPAFKSPTADAVVVCPPDPKALHVQGLRGSWHWAPLSWLHSSAADQDCGTVECFLCQSHVSSTKSVFISLLSAICCLFLGCLFIGFHCAVARDAGTHLNPERAQGSLWLHWSVG